MVTTRGYLQLECSRYVEPFRQLENVAFSRLCGIEKRASTVPDYYSPVPPNPRESPVNFHNRMQPGDRVGLPPLRSPTNREGCSKGKGVRLTFLLALWLTQWSPQRTAPPAYG